MNENGHYYGEICKDEDEYELTNLTLQGENTDSSLFAIQARGVFYTHSHLTKKPYVLNGVDINVPKGQIYSLLGPSGCGKSTFLKCLTGIIIPNRGSITLSVRSTNCSVHSPGIGYMPQELALLGDLTTRETLWLFGRLTGIPSELLTGYIQRLSEMFDLSLGNRCIENLSGGQKRRVSLACALLQDPPLLVLDEPTVGIDPILRKTIWDYLINLSQTKQTTILLTTHYIEEAKNANVIGLMREGKILAESRPSDLLSHFGVQTLEGAFYRLCENTECLREELSTLSGYQKSSYGWSKEKAPSKDSTLNQHSPSKVSILHFSLTNILPSLITKNLKLLQRFYFLLFFQVVFPSLVIYFCGKCLGNTVFDFPLGISNEESPVDLSQELVRLITSNPIEPHFFNDKNSAIEFVKSGKSVVSVHIPREFSTCFRNKIELGIHSTEGDVKCASVYMYADTTNRVNSLTVQQMLIRAFEEFAKEYICNYTDATPLIANLPLTFEETVYGNINASYTEYILPSVLLITIHYLTAALSGVTLINENTQGVLERFSVCGVTKVQIFFAHLCNSVLVLFGQVSLMLATQFILFETKIYGSYVLALTIIGFQGLCGLLFAYLLSSLTKSVMALLLTGMGAFIINLNLCGFMWPVESMPRSFRFFVRFLPLTQTIQALRSVMSKGWGIEHFEVQMGLLSVLSWSTIFLLAAVLIYRVKN